MDLRQLEKQIGRKLELKLSRYLDDKQDITLQILSQFGIYKLLHAVIKFTNILYNDVYKRITIFSDYAVKMSNDTGQWELKPKPLFFGDHYQYIAIQPDDIGYGSEININTNISDYIFSNINNTLMIFAFNIVDNKQDTSKSVSLILKDFFNSNKMQSLLVKFNNINIVLQDVMHNASSIISLEERTNNLQQFMHDIISTYNISDDSINFFTNNITNEQYL